MEKFDVYDNDGKKIGTATSAPDALKDLKASITWDPDRDVRIAERKAEAALRFLDEIKARGGDKEAERRLEEYEKAQKTKREQRKRLVRRELTVKLTGLAFCIILTKVFIDAFSSWCIISGVGALVFIALLLKMI